jgi:5-methylcytosine-specific restriction endonuclease McrA
MATSSIWRLAKLSAPRPSSAIGSRVGERKFRYARRNDGHGAVRDPYPGLPAVRRQVHAPLGYCMYCNSTTDLSSEHIVPLALGGEIELPASSCQRCAAVTSRLELKLLRGPLWRARLALGMKSRRKHRAAPTEMTVELERDGVTAPVTLATSEAPAIVTFPTFAPPRVAAGASGPGIDVTGFVAINFGGDLEELARSQGAQCISVEDQTPPFEFALLLTKIAYGMAVATGAIAELVEPSPLPAIILGRDDRVGDYVGAMTDALARYPGQLHRIAIGVDESAGYLVADVQLFSQSLSPRYAVVIGRARTPGAGALPSAD